MLNGTDQRLNMSEITDRICRACLEPSTKTYPLVGSIFNVNVNIANMLEYCTSKKLDLNDNLPQDICLGCFKSIRIAYNFLKQFQESQEKLYELWNVCKDQQGKNEDECNGDTSNSDDQYDLQNIHGYSVESHTIKKEYKIEDPVGSEEIQKEILSEECNEIYENESNETDDIKMEDSTQSNDEKVIYEVKYFESFDPEIFEIKYMDDESDMPVKVQSTNSKNNDDTGVLQTSEISSEKKSEEKVVQFVKDQFASIVYKCPICPKMCYQYRVFHEHVLSHNMENIVCTRCTSKVELSIDEFFSHYKEFHKYQCDICKKCLSSGYGYQYHMKHHEDIKKHKCPYEGCKRSYFFNSLLQKHLRFHATLSVHPCDLCSATYRSIEALRYHKKTHEGDRNHLCIHCGKAFYQAVHLRDHINRHMGHKSFTCDICGKSFITNSQLTKHISLCTKKNRKI